MNDSMNVHRLVSAMTLVAAVLCAACSEDSTADPTPVPDSGVVTDTGPVDVDTGVADAGALAKCPVPGNFENGVPQCTEANDCQDDQPPVSSCVSCRPFNPVLCSLGRCDEPDVLGGNEGIFIRFSIVGLETEIQSFAGVGVMAETTGGETISCDDVYASSWDLMETCYNWVDSRFVQIVTSEPAQSYPFRFGRFPGGRKTLLIIYGFSSDDASGNPIGVSCTEADVHEAGTRDSDLQVPGDTMRRI